jgi:hypothetical protein
MARESRTVRIVRSALLLSALAFAALLCALPVQAQKATPCTPPEQLHGRDTLLVYLPCASLDVLKPEFRKRVECTLKRMDEHGHWKSAVPYETYRSDPRQRRLYEQGRTRPGAIVTNAKSAAESAHGQHEGADIVHSRDGWRNPRFFKSLEDHAFTCGLESGNGWLRMPDGPHLEPQDFRVRKKQVGGK